MKDSHTGENIANELKATQLRWSLPEVIATTDNAANEQKTHELLKWQRFGCYEHRINLILKNALKVHEVGRILGKARKLVTFFHQSSSATDLLQTKQELLLGRSLIGHKLIIDVVTRWNSTLYMLRRVIEQTPALMALISDPSLTKTASTTLKNCVFSFEEQTLVEALICLLGPFEKATTIIRADKSPTMHKVLTIVMKMRQAAEIQPDDFVLIQKVKRNIQQEIMNRTKPEDISLLGCIVNPFTKDLDFMPGNREEAHNLLRNAVFSVDMQVVVKQEKKKTDQDDIAAPLSDLPCLPKDIENVPNDIENGDQVTGEEIKYSPPSKKPKSADTEDWLADVVCTGESKVVEDIVIDKEIDRYLTQKISKEDYNLSVLE